MGASQVRVFPADSRAVSRVLGIETPRAPSPFAEEGSTGDSTPTGGDFSGDPLC